MVWQCGVADSSDVLACLRVTCHQILLGFHGAQLAGELDRTFGTVRL